MADRGAFPSFPSFGGTPFRAPALMTPPGGLVRTDRMTELDPNALLRAPRIGEQLPVIDVPETKIGSPLNTLYGVDDESFLTDDQRKMMRMIQGRFDSSMNRRDRELARYGAPRLANFVQDEALARAIAGAQALNYRPPEEKDVFGAPVRGANFPQGQQLRSPAAPAAPGAPKEPQRQDFSDWQRIIGGLASIAPLLFGKDAYGNFLNKGLLQWAKEKVFGPEMASTISDQQLEAAVQGGAFPDAGGYQVNPFTGMPMGPSIIPGPPSPDVIAPTAPIDPSGWWDEGVGQWYPSDMFSPDDPFGIGGW